MQSRSATRPAPKKVSFSGFRTKFDDELVLRSWILPSRILTSHTSYYFLWLVKSLEGNIQDRRTSLSSNFLQKRYRSWSSPKSISPVRCETFFWSRHEKKLTRDFTRTFLLVLFCLLVRCQSFTSISSINPRNYLLRFLLAIGDSTMYC